MKSEIGKLCDDGSISIKLSFFLHIHRKSGDNHIAVNNFSVLITHQTPVGISVERDTDIIAAVNNISAKRVHLSRTAVSVDINSVRIIGDKIAFISAGMLRRKDVFGGRACRSVR